MIHELISERKSIRAFAGKEIDAEVLVQLFEAARWAPSSRNEQPWRFIVARKAEKESFEKILLCLNESNRGWARHAAVLIITIAKKTFGEDTLLNSHAQHDVGLAIGNLSLQATAMGISLHQMGGFDKDATRTFFTIPAEYEAVSIIAGGYKGSLEMLPENMRQRELQPRIRKNLDELIFSDMFGKKSSLLNNIHNIADGNNKSN